MKIVQLLPYDMARHGGVQRHVRDLSRWLVTQGHQVRIVAPPTPGQAPLRQGELWQLGRSWMIGLHGTGFELSLAGPMALRALARDLRGWGAQVVHMHTPWTPAMVWQVWRQLRLPTVTTIHATLPRAEGAGLADRYIRAMAKHLLRRSEAVVVPSQAPLPMLRALVPGLRAEVLPPAVDLGDWFLPKGQRRPLAVACLGRLEPRKGIDILLRAWPQVVATLPGAHLTVAGDGPLRGAVEAATNASLTYAGRPDDARARALMGETDILVAPAPYGESYGLVLAEAMAAGAVPVAAANAGYAHVLGDEHRDLLVPPGDAGALAAAIVALGRDPERRETLRGWARDRARASDVTAAGPEYLKLYQAVLSA